MSASWQVIPFQAHARPRISGCVVALRRQHPLQYRVASSGNVPNRGEHMESNERIHRILAGVSGVYWPIRLKLIDNPHSNCHST